MKKFFIVITVFLLSGTICFADELNLETEAKYQKKVMEIGFKILNANRIEKRVTFHYITEKTPNAYAYSPSKAVVIHKGLLPYLDNEDELAGVIGHEIAHNMDFYEGYFRKVAMMFAPKKYEKKADTRAVDYLVKAGYNPVAMIIALNKITAEPTSWLITSNTHPAGSERLAYIYEYIFKKYPAYLVDNDYKKNIYYQNFLLTSKEDRQEIRKEFEENKREKQKEKIGKNDL